MAMVGMRPPPNRDEPVSAIRVYEKRRRRKPLLLAMSRR
jgi:hypothetical protein